MTNSHKLTVALAVLLAVFCIVAGHGWLKEHEAAVQVAAQQQATNEYIKNVQLQEAANQARLDATLAQLSDLKKTVQTPAQVVAALPKVMPSLPEPIHQVTDAQAKAADAVIDSAGTSDTPIQAGDLVIPKDDAKQFFDQQIDCEADQARVEADRETIANLNSVVTAKNALIAQQNIALKGGTKWKRFKHDLKVGAVGVGVGAVVVAVVLLHH